MKLSFHIYARAPLGRELRTILAVCDGYSATRAQGLRLATRQGRADVPVEELLRSASESASEICRIPVAQGEISLQWLYGPRRAIPTVWGTLVQRKQEVDEFRHFVGRLAGVVEA